ncbi:membrane-spanning 4-domains subfamily A member 14 [Ochotona curzoniae]|uniref:membrane-spanning 4-domains subfamily A member 14 n=1 Tax=Ochotona curzoniae TaxID=130825 RepID=UPI001B34EC11|nr:membrane-spanning 4-domains subfamily A member 14 [Ochotona curzoniae]
MELSTEAKRAIALKPSQTVLTAFPYRPHSTLLDLLRGEPKVLGAVQILLALSILGIGIIFLLSYISFSIEFPVVFLTGYPFWGALIFLLAGCLTITDKSKKLLGLGITTVHVISCLVAVAGIALTILSYPKQHRFCQNYQPSFEGVCALGRIMLMGILSILLIISIVELSISVSVASLRAKCWMRSNEVVFFLPADITQNSEQSATPEENVQLKFELQNDSISEDATKTEIVFFGSYAFFKLKVSRITSSSPPTSQPHPTDRDDYETTSGSVPDIPLSFKFLGEENKLKKLSPILEKKISTEKKSSDDIIYAQPDFTTGQQKDKEIEYASVQHPQMQLQLLKDEDLPIKNFLIDSVQNPQTFPPNDLPSQALIVQQTPGKGLLNNSPPSHIIESYDLTSEDLPFQDIPSIDKLSQDTKSQDMQLTTKSSQDTPSQHIISEEMQYGIVPSQDIWSQNSKSQSKSSLDKLTQNMPFQDVTKSTSQDTLSQNTPSQDMTFQTLSTHVQISSTQQLSEQSPDHQPQNVQAQKQRSSQVLYQDIQSEVSELTQGWKSLEQLHGRKSSRRHSSDWQSKEEQSPRRHSLELQSKGSPPAKRKSIDQQIKGWLFPRRHSVDKKTQYTQTSEQLSEQQTEDQQAKVGQSSDREGDQVPKEQFSDRQSEDQLAAKKQTQGRHTEDQCGSPSGSQFLEEQPPEWTTQNWQSSNQQNQDWRKNNWQNKDWKTQEWQFEMQPSLNWEPQARQTQDQLEEETLKQKALQQEDQTQHTMKRYYFGQQSQHFLCQDSQNQDKNQQNFLFRFTMKEDTQTERMQITDNQLADTKYRDQQLVDLQSEDMKPDCHPSSSQSLEQDTCLAYSSNIGSEQDVQQNTSVCSDSYKEDLNFLSSSCHSKEQQQSEESD